MVFTPRLLRKRTIGTGRKETHNPDYGRVRDSKSYSHCYDVILPFRSGLLLGKVLQVTHVVPCLAEYSLRCCAGNRQHAHSVVSPVTVDKLFVHSSHASHFSFDRMAPDSCRGNIVISGKSWWQRFLIHGYFYDCILLQNEAAWPKPGHGPHTLHGTMWSTASRLWRNEKQLQRYIGVMYPNVLQGPATCVEGRR